MKRITEPQPGPVASMHMIGTEDEPMLRVEFTDGATQTLTVEELRRFASDILDWALLAEDISGLTQHYRMPE